MSRVAHEFWNHKRIAQSEARARLKALGILTGDDARLGDENKKPESLLIKTKYLTRVSISEALAYRAKRISDAARMYRDASQ